MISTVMVYNLQLILKDVPLTICKLNVQPGGPFRGTNVNILLSSSHPTALWYKLVKSLSQ